MGRFRRLISMGLIAGFALLAVGPARAAAPVPLGATVAPDLDGRPIAVSEISYWYCHDLDYPRIHCFRSPVDLTRVLTTRGTRPRTDAVGMSTALVYVIAYRDAGYLGPSIAISRDYDDLRTIGWNDVISSFKAVNGLYGHFAVDIYNGGRTYPFCCNVSASYVGDAWNDQFSSVYSW